MRVPAFMLKKLYVPGSLKPTPDGFTFRLRNTLATATLVTPPTITVDGTPVPPQDVHAVMNGATLGAKDVTADTPLALTKGVEVEMVVRGRTLAPGSHRIGIKSESKEWETIAFEIDDKV